MPNTDSEIKSSLRTAPLLLDLLVCPDTKSLLIYDKHAQELISLQARKAFPIDQNVPMLAQIYARDLTAGEVIDWQAKNKAKN